MVKSLELQTIDNIKNKDIPVIIFGARSVGEALFYACRKIGIKVECFCDNDFNRTENLVCNTKVIHTSELKNKYQDAVFLISAADIKDVIEQLRHLGYSKWYPSTLLLRDFNIYKYAYSVPADFVEYTINTCLLCHDGYLNPDKLFLRSVDIVITERCSLRCKDCSNLMRYYENPQDCNTKELFKNIDRFLDVIDEVNEFRVLGGEPFMNKDCHLIIRKLIEESKVKKIVIYTNGTIPPKDEQIQLIKSKKVLFIITDYGKLSRNLNSIVQKLSENNIAYYVQKAGGWTNCSKIKKQNRSSEKQKEIFRNCCAKNTFTLSDANLFRCPFSANAHRLQAVPNFKNDHVNIFWEKKNIKEIKTKIKSFILDKKFLETCDYCNGRSFGDPLITPAVQINKSLEYKKYTY
ncbi:MAG: radical SAM protein [uncultured bacterium]|nr:MAG: radical SAM protein [uncultured bacterium]